jgi:rubrerythrin
MSVERIIDIFKNAILLEYKGKALYESVVSTTKLSVVRELFKYLAEEEEKHIDFLKNQLIHFCQESSFEEIEISKDLKEQFANLQVLNDRIIHDVFGASYEAAVISAALDFEKKAQGFYREKAEQAKEEKEKEIYRILSDWEMAHMTILSELDQEIQKKIWHDNNFWPLD